MRDINIAVRSTKCDVILHKIILVYRKLTKYENHYNYIFYQFICFYSTMQHLKILLSMSTTNFNSMSKQLVS